MRTRPDFSLLGDGVRIFLSVGIEFCEIYAIIVLLVLDGMGLDVLNAHAPNGFLAKNCVAQLSSVYPYTTVSALITFETGLTPTQHGWLGWAQYFEERL